MLDATSWWQVMMDYNDAIFPLQWILYVMSVGVFVAFLFMKEKQGNALVQVFLGVVNLWIGIFFFVLLGKGFKPPMNYSQGFLFVMIGIFYFIDLFRGKFRYQLPENKTWRWIWIALMVLVFVYPWFGAFEGKPINEWIFVGAFPCPTTAMGLVFLMSSMPKANKIHLLLFSIWALPFPPTVQIPQYGVYEDGILFMTGIMAVVLFVWWLFHRKPVAIEN
jgi:hypothetical protein